MRGALATATAVVCSCAMAGILREGEYKAHPLKFDFVAVDEAGQAMAAEALIPMTLAADNGARCLAAALLCGLMNVLHSPFAAW